MELQPEAGHRTALLLARLSDKEVYSHLVAVCRLSRKRIVPARVRYLRRRRPADAEQGVDLNQENVSDWYQTGFQKVAGLTRSRQVFFHCCKDLRLHVKKGSQSEGLSGPRRNNY